MDEMEYQTIREILNQCPCPFEKALLSSRCTCAKFQRLNIAEREAAACILPAAQVRCIALLEQLYQNARFALKQPRMDKPQPHNKAMKIQCGGLLGLQAALSPECDNKQVENIDALVTQALKNYGELEKLPYQEIVKFISHYQVRVKRF